MYNMNYSYSNNSSMGGSYDYHHSHNDPSSTNMQDLVYQFGKKSRPFIIAGVTLVAGMAWKDTTKEFFELIFGENDGIYSSFFSALIITLILVVMILLVPSEEINEVDELKANYLNTKIENTKLKKAQALYNDRRFTPINRNFSRR